MTVRRIMGIKTEYGISHPDRPWSSSVDLSREIIGAYSRAVSVLGHGDDVAWDRTCEMPALDTIQPASHINGERNIPDVPKLTSQVHGAQRGTTKALSNGARLYVDRAHPEYSSPECISPRQAVLYDRAGEQIMRRAVDTLVKETGSGPAVYKNNVDGKGAAYGCHESYLTDRLVPFDDFVAALIPFLVTRPILVGAGRVGLGPGSEEAGFQLSQRADYIESVVGASTNCHRPLVSTKDEPHAEPQRYRRLHVVSGDSNCLPSNTLLKLGMTSLILWVVETAGLPEEWKGLQLADPVGAVRHVSRDLSLKRPLELADGRRMTALEIQSVYRRSISRLTHEFYTALGSRPDVETVDILDRWRDTIGLLSDDWRSTIGDVEWATKLALLEALRTRDELHWDAPELMAMDLQWSAIRAEQSLARHLMERGILEPIAVAEWIDSAEFSPPASTRAWFRGELIRRFPNHIRSASWESVVLELDGGRLYRVPMISPEASSHTRIGAKLGKCETVDDVLQMFAGSHHLACSV